jgi:crotonobetainyl-CoA:carnitine CoA-transferase CaiB-like acyl-CoA transferase
MKRPPLTGVRILCLAEQYPGPYATLLLADLGAEVIIVERPGGGDPARLFPSFHGALNRNKRSLALDLKDEVDRARLFRLVETADVFMEGFRPGTISRLGFGPETLRAAHPRLVYVSISGFGQDGPYRDRPAHDLSYQAAAGLLSQMTGTTASTPPSDIAIGDLSSGLFAALGIVTVRSHPYGSGHLSRRLHDGRAGVADVGISGRGAERRRDRRYRCRTRLCPVHLQRRLAPQPVDRP